MFLPDQVEEKNLCFIRMTPDISCFSSPTFFNPISLSQFLTVLSLTLVSTYFFFIFVHFLFIRHIALSFYWSTLMFSFYNFHTLFIFASSFTHSWLGTTTILCHTACWIYILKEFYNPFHCFNCHFSFWGHVFFHLAKSNSSVGSVSFS